MRIKNVSKQHITIITIITTIVGFIIGYTNRVRYNKERLTLEAAMDKEHKELMTDIIKMLFIDAVDEHKRKTED